VPPKRTLPPDTFADRGLAATGLADQRQRVAGSDRQRNAVDGLHVANDALEQALADGEVDFQIDHFEQFARSGRRQG
jgi:hypothetical protein